MSEVAMGALKDFQRVTARYAFHRMYRASPPSTRFLIADEVGLGKTKVARAVIEQLLEHERSRPLDIIYVCSNEEIARQNLPSLRVPGMGDGKVVKPGRLTLLPLKLTNRSPDEVNLFAVSPGTSFSPGQREGTMGERGLLFAMLERAWGPGMLSQQRRHLFRGTSGLASARAKISAQQQAIEGIEGFDRVIDRFGKQISRHDAEATSAGRLPFEQQLLELAEALPTPQTRVSENALELRRAFISTGRRILARAALADLRPSLIILDEFQRFSYLIQGDGADSELARDLFALRAHPEAAPPRILLLSATPYQPYITHAERSLAEGADDHRREVRDLARFLFDGLDGAEHFDEELDAALRAYTPGLRRASMDDGAAAREAAGRVAAVLRPVMCRTERLAALRDGDGMVVTRTLDGLSLEVADAKAFVAIDSAAQALQAGSQMELWKSTPFFPTFASPYVLGRAIRRLPAQPDGPSATVVKELARAELPAAEIQRYADISVPHPRMRALSRDVFQDNLEQLLWMPPALPYYAPQGPYAKATAGATKRLVFSSWKAVPEATAAVLRYEAQRRAVCLGGARRRRFDDMRPRTRLAFRADRGRPSSWPIFAMLYPSRTLASLGGARAHASGSATLPTWKRTKAPVVAAIRKRLAGLPQGKSETGEASDARWYAAAPVLMDRSDPRWTIDDLLQFGHVGALADLDDDKSDGAPARSRLTDHVEWLASDIAEADLDSVPLGRRPDDLADVLADMSLAAPGPCALRALELATSGRAPMQTDPAGLVAFSIRTLFNRVESAELLEGLFPEERAYWRRVLQYCIDGNLQSVLDEYMHLLVEQSGLRTEPLGPLTAQAYDGLYDEMLAVGEAAGHAAALEAGRIVTDSVTADDPSGAGARLTFTSPFAARFTDERSAETKDEATRASGVRGAFNSPFRPFVLITTSVGQEGLDFHSYCHAVVHWNIPRNPVDFEQREGRVHRYKGHAVRKNVAQRYRGEALRAPGDPWRAAFDAAQAGRSAGDNDLVPFWVMPGNAKIERILMAQPLSRDIGRARDVQSELALYRLAFGQPRQEDLLQVLADDPRVSASNGTFRESLMIDLTPPPEADWAAAR